MALIHSMPRSRRIWSTLCLGTLLALTPCEAQAQQTLADVTSTPEAAGDLYLRSIRAIRWSAVAQFLQLISCLILVSAIDIFLFRGAKEIGSLRWGKKADFTILEEDPYAVPLEDLRDIPVWGTVFEGELYPLE